MARSSHRDFMITAPRREMSLSFSFLTQDNMRRKWVFLSQGSLKCADPSTQEGDFKSVWTAEDLELTETTNNELPRVESAKVDCVDRYGWPAKIFRDSSSVQVCTTNNHSMRR